MSPLEVPKFRMRRVKNPAENRPQVSLTSTVCRPKCFVNTGVHFFSSLLARSFMPALHWLHDLERNLERRVDLAMNRFRDRPFSDLHDPAVSCWQYHRDNLMRAELLADAPPGGVNPLVQESLFDSNQQVIGQHTQKDGRLRSILKLVENRPLHQRSLHVSKRLFHSREQNVGAPNL